MIKVDAGLNRRVVWQRSPPTDNGAQYTLYEAKEQERLAHLDEGCSHQHRARSMNTVDQLLLEVERLEARSPELAATAHLVSKFRHP